MTAMYYNCIDYHLYTTASYLKLIRKYDLNLTLIEYFSVYPYLPLSITGYNNQIFVGTTNGNVLEIFNQIITNVFNGCNGYVQRVMSILVDGNGNMATGCDNWQLYLYTTTGFYQNKIISARGALLFFDLKSQLVVSSWYQVYIYN
jgi:hypothetical protein